VILQQTVITLLVIQHLPVRMLDLKSKLT